MGAEAFSVYWEECFRNSATAVMESRIKFIPSSFKAKEGDESPALRGARSQLPDVVPSQTKHYEDAACPSSGGQNRPGCRLNLSTQTCSLAGSLFVSHETQPFAV